MKLIKFFLFILFVTVASNAMATHNRAGEITYQFVGSAPTELKYLITITTYTKTSSFQADRESLDSVYFGDGTGPQSFPRISKTNLPNDISINVYQKTHTYSGSGRFLIYFTDPNRNEGVKNIPNSVYVPFYLETELVINANLGATNNSPVLTYPPIDQGCVNRIFIHNANAYDPDGDSLSYGLVVCGGLAGQPIPGYIFPPASVSFDINSVTGDLTWNSPIDTGEYNVAFHIYQWRRGAMIGYVRRDMQILIENCNNLPPVITAMADTCVLAGDTLDFDVTAIDPNGDHVTLTASGGPFLVGNAATFTPVVQNNDTVISHFNWVTNCTQIRNQPYYAQFKAEDDAGAPEIPLVDLKGRFIKVIGPAPQNLTAVAVGSTINLTWQAPPGCNNVYVYNIYRRTGRFNGTLECPCDNGVPSSTGYVRIASVNASTLAYADNNNNGGLSIGVEYCYLVTAVYGFNGPEGCASDQACVSLRKDGPVITNADVTSTDNVTGSVYVTWGKATDLDTLQYPGPYEYRLFHSPDLNGTAFDPNPVFVSSNPDDTIYTDVNLDTRSHGWSYRVDFYYTDNGVLTFKSSTAVASTIFLSIAPTDNQLNLSWSLIVPWTNTRYDIFKLNTVTGVYDSIASTVNTTYADTGLLNGTEYCYYIRSTGSYNTSGLLDPIINRSQQTCATPIDNDPPCSPPLVVLSSCEDFSNTLIWLNPNNFCSDDVQHYEVYYSRTLDDPNFELIWTSRETDTVFYHTNLEVVTGCYRVIAIDSVGNRSTDPYTVCVDTCREYVLPSVFTPDGDGRNDLFHPCDSSTSTELQAKNCPPYKNVRSVNIKIYNRWGTIVYETNDIDVNWDGKDQKTKKDCSEGVYYYTATVNFYRIRGDAVKELHGTVQLIRAQ